MRQKLFYRAALPGGALLIVLALPRLCLAQNADNPGGNQWGVAPTGPLAVPSSGYNNIRQIVPGPPVQPTSPSRPASWPGALEQTAQSFNQYPAASASQESPKELYEGTKILARVGSEAIFAYEITGGVDEILEPYKDKFPASQLEAQRTLMIKQRLKSRIESKLIYQDARRTIPAEGITNAEKHIIEYFQSTELPKMLKRGKVESTTELDQKLRTLGSSLEREKKAFTERVLAEQWVGQQIKHDEEITYDQMLKCYREQIADFEQPARARWEELMVPFANYPGKDEAYTAIAQLGNQVLSGAEFAEVAKKGSQGATSAQGGVHDWTTQGNLVCEQLDQALFGLPPGTLSPIIEGRTGYYIIRVIERTETQVTPFLAAQVEIKKKIAQQRTAKQIQDYLARLEDKTPIWTIFDGDQKNLRLADRFKDLPR